MTLPDRAGAQPNPYDHWAQPERQSKGVMISDALALYHPAFVASLQQVTDRFLAQDSVVPSGDLIVAQVPPNIPNFGLHSIAEAVHLVVGEQIKLRTGSARYAALVAGANFEEPRRAGTHYGTLVCGTVADKRDPAVYVPVALSVHAYPIRPYTVRWLARAVQGAGSANPPKK